MGTVDRRLPHEASPACPELQDFFVLVVIPLFQSGSRVQTKTHRLITGGFYKILKRGSGDHIRRGKNFERKKKKGGKNGEIFFVFHWIQEQRGGSISQLQKNHFQETFFLHSNFQKSFQKTQKKNIERLKFLGSKPGPEGGQISHCTQVFQHLSVNHCRWSIAWWEGHPSGSAVVVTVRLNRVTIKPVQGS